MQKRSLPGPVIAAGVWMLMVVLIALFADQLRPYSAQQLDLRYRLSPPLSFNGKNYNLLGTDELGRDVLSQLIDGNRLSLLILFGLTAVASLLGATLGLVARSSARVERAGSWLAKLEARLPFLMLELAVVSFLCNVLPLSIGFLGLYGWEQHTRVARGMPHSANGQGFDSGRLVQQTAITLIISAALSLPELVLLESWLSYWGLGVRPPRTSLGTMIAEGRRSLDVAPWIVLPPGSVLALTTLSVILLSDWARRRLDPASGA